MIQTVPLGALISIGFAGGLCDSLRAGELVLAEAVIEPESGERFACSEGLLPMCSGRRGILLSVPQVVSAAEQKHLLARRWGALAVDMESGGVARVARQAGLPRQCRESSVASRQGRGRAAHA